MSNKVTRVKDATNPNCARIYVNGGQWMKVYGWDEHDLTFRCNIIIEALEKRLNG